MNQKFDLCADDYADGEVIYYDPTTGVKHTKYNIDDKTYAIKKEYPATQEMLDANARDRSNSFGTKWGEGRIIGRLPMHLMDDENLGLSQALSNHDEKYLMKFLNDNPAFKTRDKI
jgi:hypothetical protein